MIPFQCVGSLVRLPPNDQKIKKIANEHFKLPFSNHTGPGSHSIVMSLDWKVESKVYCQGRKCKFYIQTFLFN